MAKFAKGDKVVATNAFNSHNNGARGIVSNVCARAVRVTLTEVPKGCGLVVGNDFEFVDDSLTLDEQDQKPVLISASEIKVGDEIEVTQKYRGVTSVNTGVVDHFGQLTYYTKENGILFSREWDAEVRLIKAHGHPLETAVPGDRFSVEYPGWAENTYEVVKHAQGFWLREGFDKDGVLIEVLSVNESMARSLFDTKNGKLKK